MSVVVDASVLIAVVVNEPEKDSLIAVTRGEDLIAPQSVHWEIGNALSAMLKRQRITLSQALQIVETCREIPIRFLDVDLASSLRIADEFGLYAYDAYLIACADKHRSPLLSLDRNLLQVAKRMRVQVVEVA